MSVVAISRELGTSSTQIASDVARELGAELVDRRIIDEIAGRLRIAREDAAQYDERPEGMLERLFNAMSTADAGGTYGEGWSWTPPYAGDPAFDARRASREVTEDVIRRAARLGNVVIVGRGATYLLRDEAHALRVFLRAPQDARIEMVRQRFTLDAKAARERVKQSDVNWGAYVRDAYHVDWRDPASYDLVIDTSRIAIPAAVSLIVTAARSR